MKPSKPVWFVLLVAVACAPPPDTQADDSDLRMRPRVAAAAPEPPAEEEQVPFYRKVIAHSRGEDPGGFGPNWSNVDDFDIPTVLRKQMD